MIASTLAVAGAGLTGAGLAAAWKLAGRVAHADGASQTLDAPAQALAPAVRIQPPNRLTFPVQLPGDLVVLDNFGAPRTFGPGRHEGIDIGRRDQLPGHPLVACLDGVLVEQQILAPNQGNSWVLQAADGMAYRYHHLADFEPGLSVGDVVTRGQVIGTMGRTGNPNVPHLHFEARRGGPIGTPIDPFPLLPLPLPGVAVT
jgi:murein DD-endopeptidase MepM/ murein hydrolase activator NlpD